MTEKRNDLNSKNSVIISKVSLYPIRTPRISGDASQHVLIRLDTDSGIVGVGEGGYHRSSAHHGRSGRSSEKFFQRIVWSECDGDIKA